MSCDGWKRPRFRNQFLLNSAWSDELPPKVASTRDCVPVCSATLSVGASETRRSLKKCSHRRLSLRTLAPPYATLTLLLETAMGLGLLLGALLARRRYFRAHAWCQSTIVLINVVAIVLAMIPSFRGHVSPKIPMKLAKPYYALATIHAALGGVTEIAGLYILLAAGTSVLPQKFRITRYKAWMRTVLVLWWLVLLLGSATYVRWYVPNLFSK
jgi:uncharacterized membrane protein YozB (DUF420 family)